MLLTPLRYVTQAELPGRVFPRHPGPLAWHIDMGNYLLSVAKRRPTSWYAAALSLNPSKRANHVHHDDGDDDDGDGSVLLFFLA